MVNDLEIGPNGHHDLEEESPEQIKAVLKNLSDLKREDGSLVRLTPQQLSLLQKMLTAPEEHKREQVFLICDFLDEEEALDHVAAYYEALDLGMDAGFNVAFMFALAASNRKGDKTNRVAMLLDALQHVKYTANTVGQKHGDRNPRSPISG